MEISEAYRYCPICGTSRVIQSATRPFRCHHCQHTSFFGPVTAVGGVITNPQNEVLLIERARDPGKGKLGMPGGFVDPQESAEAALRRESMEEVGLALTELTFLMTAPNAYVYNGITYPVVDLYFHARVDSNLSILADASEVSNWRWCVLTTKLLEQMAFQSNRSALEFFLDCQRPDREESSLPERMRTE